MQCRAWSVKCRDSVASETRSYNHFSDTDTGWPTRKPLGVLLASKLTWKAQHVKVRGKAVRWTVVPGIRMNEAGKLYNAVAVPTPLASGLRLNIRAKLTRIQQALDLACEATQGNAAVSITGALRTSQATRLLFTPA